MLIMRNYQPDYSIYSFKKEDSVGDYENGVYRKGSINVYGYVVHQYRCNDGKWHLMAEHLAKWEYFNGRVPEGLQIDHILPVRNGGTNKMSNLRVVTPKENSNNPISRKNKSESKKGEKHPMYGKHLTEECKRKLSAAFLGEKNPMYGKERPEGSGIQPKKVYQYNLKNELIKIYDSTCQAASENNFSQGNIASCCRGERQTHKGYKWSYEPL